MAIMINNINIIRQVIMFTCAAKRRLAQSWLAGALLLTVHRLHQWPDPDHHKFCSTFESSASCRFKCLKLKVSHDSLDHPTCMSSFSNTKGLISFKSWRCCALGGFAAWSRYAYTTEQIMTGDLARQQQLSAVQSNSNDPLAKRGTDGYGLDAYKSRVSLLRWCELMCSPSLTLTNIKPELAAPERNWYVRRLWLNMQPC